MTLSRLNTSESNNKVLRLEGGFFSTKVRFLEGDCLHQAGWVPNSWIK